MTAPPSFRWLVLLRISKWFMLYMPVLILFYQANGLSLEAALSVQALYSLMIALWEIPSGYISDRWGRRNALLLGMTLVALQFIVLAASSDFAGFALGVLLGGTGVSFISGTDSALLYEILAAEGQQSEYLRLEGRLYAIGNISEATAAILGGILASFVSLRLPIALQAFFSLVGVWAAWQIVEPPHPPRSPAHPFRDVWKILGDLFRHHRPLLYWICLSSVAGSASHILAWTTQPYLKTWGWSEWAIGLAWSLLNLLVAVVSWYAYRWYKGRDPQQVATRFMVMLIGGYVALAFSWWLGSLASFIALAALFAVRGVAVPFFKDSINAHTPADARATILSIREFVVRMLYVFVAPWMGYWADLYSLEWAFLMEAGLVGLMWMGVQMMRVR